MRRPQGYGVISSPAAAREYDTITCGHCQRVVFTKPGSVGVTYLLPGRSPDQPWKEVEGAGCRVCMRSVCLVCYDLGRCIPFEQKIEAMEGNRRALAAVLGV